MPTLQKIFTLEITPEKFVDNCSDVELQEVILLANKKLSYYDATPVAEESKESKVNKDNKVCKDNKEALKGLPKSPKGKSGRWTAHEDATLREMWPNMAVLNIAFKMKRGYNSVMGRANRLGLSKRARRTDALPAPKSKKVGRATDCIGIETGLKNTEL
jgi:hypothetical protein